MTIRTHVSRAGIAGLLTAAAIALAGAAAPATAAANDAQQPTAAGVSAEVKSDALIHSAPSSSAVLPMGIGRGTQISVDCWVNTGESFFKLSGGQSFYLKTVHVKVADKSRLPQC